ncbi:MAG: rhomboid family intramembrane serine protease [Candidatus Krumholzibacteriia bacterium]
MHRRRFSGGGVTFGPGLTLGPAVKGLLIANFAVFVLQVITRSDALVQTFAFTPRLAFQQFELWRFVTYMFIHDGLWHVGLNMFVLWMFGTQLEGVWGSRSFVIYYFVGGVGGAVTYGLFSLVNEPMALMLGASGAVYAILLAYGVTFPNAVIMLFLVLPIKAKYLVVLFALIELLSMPRGGNIAHWAHLGGMVFGLAFLWFFGGLGRGRGRSLHDVVRSWRRWRGRARFRVVTPRNSAGPTPRRRGAGGRGGNGGTDGVSGDRIDAILDKISREGLESLTDEEKNILRRASRKR